jgi:hypothetical protein
MKSQLRCSYNDPNLTSGTRLLGELGFPALIKEAKSLKFDPKGNEVGNKRYHRRSSLPVTAARSEPHFVHVPTVGAQDVSQISVQRDGWPGREIMPFKEYAGMGLSMVHETISSNIDCAAWIPRRS